MNKNKEIAHFYVKPVIIHICRDGRRGAQRPVLLANELFSVFVYGMQQR
jgi:hypothetical protein